MQRKCPVWILNSFLPFGQNTWLPYASVNTGEKNRLQQIKSKNGKILKFLYSIVNSDNER